MKIALPSLAAALAAFSTAAPAQAQSLAGQAFAADTGFHSFEPLDLRRSDRDFRRDHRRGDRDHRRRHRRGDAVVIGEFGWNDGWALYNNRTFEPDSYNDWWHDRPDRAFPRWVQTNANCERMWWSGSGWRC